MKTVLLGMNGMSINAQAIEVMNDFIKEHCKEGETFVGIDDKLHCVINYPDNISDEDMIGIAYLFGRLAEKIEVMSSEE